MIVDLFVSLIAALVSPLLDLLPSAPLSLPDPGPIAAALTALDGLVPILGVMRLGAVMLSALAVFLVVRGFVFLRYLLLP